MSKTRNILITQLQRGTRSHIESDSMIDTLEKELEQMFVKRIKKEVNIALQNYKHKRK